jgi:thiamine biosynthesis lipoprotein
MLDVLEKALYYSDLTDGALDCTIGDLIDLWGIGTEYAHVPDNTEIQNILRQNSYTMVVLDTDIPTVRFTQPEVTLHFGAIAKGYIADEMKSVLENYGIESGCLSLGGNVLTIGAKPSGKPWTVGITDPLSPENITATLQVTDLSVVTSGNYERYFYEDGVRYHHILDPDTGYPAENGLISATIIGSSSVDCDALSTAVYVLGSEKGMALIESLEDVEAVLITDDGTVLTSSGIEKYQFQQVTQ